MAATLQVLGLGPGVGVENTVFVGPNTGLHQQAPEVIRIAAQQQVVVPVWKLMAGQPHGRLVDANYGVPGVLRGKPVRAFAGATKRIEYKRAIE